MSAKGKAIQVLVAVSASAVAYTIYTNSLGGEKRSAPLQTKSAAVVKAQKNNNSKASRQSTAVYNENAIPGYCNPDENGK